MKTKKTATTSNAPKKPHEDPAMSKLYLPLVIALVIGLLFTIPIYTSAPTAVMPQTAHFSGKITPLDKRNIVIILPTGKVLHIDNDHIDAFLNWYNTAQAETIEVMETGTHQFPYQIVGNDDLGTIPLYLEKDEVWSLVKSNPRAYQIEEISSNHVKLKNANESLDLIVIEPSKEIADWKAGDFAIYADVLGTSNKGQWKPVGHLLFAFKSESEGWKWLSNPSSVSTVGTWVQLISQQDSDNKTSFNTEESNEDLSQGTRWPAP